MAKKLEREFVERRLYDATDGRFYLYGEYNGVAKKNEFRCSKCHHGEYIVFQNMLLTGSGRLCKNCYPMVANIRQRVSQGELSIQRYLDKKGLSYIQEYSFPKNSEIHNLRFDFAIVDDNGTLLKLIEYDGEQHFRSCDFFGGKKALIKIQKSDRKKNKYCKENNIPLCRIKYNKHGKIFEILEKYTKDVDSSISSGELIKNKVFDDNFKCSLTHNEKMVKRYEPIKQANAVKKAERNNKVIELRERGLKLKEIAVLMSVSLSTVKNILQRNKGTVN